MILCDVTISGTRVYKRRNLKGGTSSEREEGVWNFVSSASWNTGELSAIESGVLVIISDLLTVCVAKTENAVTGIITELLSVCVVNLYKSYCSCYLYFVFF
ncbi:hypothetical protein AVEN_100552-1 [Araneus ventricosus]|uniref:Uncharacterized protein n=1 Tax=Araneus ventricosus TaxID=182803 RepID=A0A4Y2I9A3_ARAVE|nr:hypothetical protein AVEN_100552-1 [Araneus ventricosus]